MYMTKCTLYSMLNGIKRMGKMFRDYGHVSLNTLLFVWY